MNHSKFITQNSKFAGGINLKDWRGPDTAMRGSANLKPEGTPKVVSEARNKLVHDGRWNGYDTPPTGPASAGSTNTKGEAIPQVVSEAKDNMIALPGQLFHTIERLFTQLKGRGMIDNSSSRTFNRLS